MKWQSISDLRNAVQQYTVGMQQHRWNNNITTAIWNKLLHDRRMPRRMTRKKGGAAYELTGAPLDYAMIPGSAFTTNPAVAVYDRFPVDPTVNPQVVSDLDVFFQSGLSRGCGVEDTSLKVPDNMGSNQVGGRKPKNHRGGGIGDAGETIVNHPYMSIGRPTLPHSLTHQWQGRVDSIPSSSDPTDHTWKYITEQPRTALNAQQLVTNLGPSVGSLYHFTRFGASTGGARKGRRKTRRSRKLNRKHRSRKH